MKTFWISGGIFALLLSLLLWNANHLQAFLAPLRADLAQAQEALLAEDWARAEDLTQGVQAQWQAKETYLHVVLPHRELDEIDLLLLETVSYLRCEKTGEYTASNEALCQRMKLLSEMEQFSLKNLF